MKLAYHLSMAASSFDRDAAERVIRRAIELDDDAGADAPHRLNESALAEAAAELGIDVTAVRRAAAEERVGLLGGEPTIADRLVGPGLVLAAHPFAASSEAAEQQVDAWLRRHGGFRKVAMRATGAEYRRRSDPVASLQRAARSVSGRELLESGVDRLRVLIEPLEADECLVAFVVDRTMGQRAAAVGVGSIAGIGSLTSVGFTLSGSEPALVGIPASIGLAAAIAIGRRLAVRETTTNLGGVLAAIAVASDPRSPSSTLPGNDALASVTSLLNRGSTLLRRPGARDEGPSIDRNDGLGTGGSAG